MLATLNIRLTITFMRSNLLLMCCICLSMSTSSVAGEIALSFDDAPLGDGAFLTGDERTQMLIDKLDSLGIEEVVFYCTTKHLAGPADEERLRAYAAAGHKLGNHTESHPRLSTVGAEAFLADVDHAHADLVDFDGFVSWFRFPMLDEGQSRPLRDSIRAALAERGYVNGYVTVDNYDWYIDRRTRTATSNGETIDLDALRDFYISTIWDGIQFYEQIATDVLGRSPKHVLLLHENDLAALFIDSLVTHIRAKGWTIISPTEAYTDPIVDSLPDVLMNNQGRIAAIARAHGVEPRALVHPSEDVAHLDSALVHRGIIKTSD
ncbi:MAG: polysaccharide deacetylase family protein [candidate division Zixibacteria bacterium]|nr:polysaccharide deacetylase family protein [candidate division Zixibacteria bacterium]